MSVPADTAQTPMMRQYLRIKANHKDEILFFRLGDFYEMFFDEAVEVSRLLNLTLTKRGDIPMCGIPHHAYKVYAARLLRAGKKIAICEQVSNPLPGELTERKVVEIITPGVLIEDDFLEQGTGNYLAAVFCPTKKNEMLKNEQLYASFAYVDISSGEFYASSFPKKEFDTGILKEIGRVQPREILIQKSLTESFPVLERLNMDFPAMLQNIFPDWRFNAETSFKRLCTLFGTENLKAFGLNENSPELPPAGLLIEYLEDTVGNRLSHISGIKVFSETDFLSLDESTRKNLELVSNLHDGSSAYTLLETVNYTRTSMGARLLRRRLHHPLRSSSEIEKRLDKVESLKKNPKAAAEIKDSLSGILDIERLIARIAMERAHGKDLLALNKSLIKVIELCNLKNKEKFDFLQFSSEEKKALFELYNLLENSIKEDCPISITEGGIIKKGFSQEADRLSELRDNAHNILDQYLISERRKTEITNLKIKYNRMIGYFLEVSKGNLDKIPDYFIRKRSVATSDRFTTGQLQQIEIEINGAEESLIALEKKLFLEIRAKVNSYNKVLHRIALEIAELDVYQSLAYAALINGWVRPVLTDEGKLIIKEGRHPVVEKHLPAGEFIPNSIALASKNNSKTLPLKEIQCELNLQQKPSEVVLPSFVMITGPNMAGKSTFLRQTALIVLLAQTGSFVPASQTELTPVDKIFCRVGASDNLARGESTFLVEMSETAYILQSATEKSLVIMDEVGRGTSTEDGLAIAQAVSEYLLTKVGAKTLFATHYRELSRLSDEKLKNLKLDIMETEGKIVFLKKVVEGVSESSYGIHVAGLAGIPDEVLHRAENLLHLRSQFENNKITEPIPDTLQSVQPLPVEELAVINEILETDTNNMTPIKALEKILCWQNTLSAR